MSRPPLEPTPLEEELRNNRVSLYWGNYRLRVDVDLAAQHGHAPAACLTWEQAITVLRAQYQRSVEEFNAVITSKPQPAPAQP